MSRPQRGARRAGVPLPVVMLAAVLAGISGLLYVQWGNYITPTQVGLIQAALPVIWVAVGGRDSLFAVALSTYVLNWINFSLSSSGNQYALVIIGALLVPALTLRDALLAILVGGLIGNAMVGTAGLIGAAAGSRRSTTQGWIGVTSRPPHRTRIRAKPGW